MGANHHDPAAALGVDRHGQLGEVHHPIHLCITLALMLLPYWVTDTVPLIPA
jgi:hypothetical protein